MQNTPNNLPIPFFSIIIPTFNSGKTLNDCLKSILCQTFCDFEILVVDGVSKDNTLDVAKSIHDTRIRIFSEPDNGIYDAMNKGIKLAKGEWVYFLGSDDVLYDSTILEYVFATNSINDLDIIYGNVLMKESNNIYDGIFTYDKIQILPFCHQSIFYRRIIINDLGCYNLKYKVLSDYDLNLKWFFSNRIKSIYIEKIIATYSINGYSSIVRDDLFYDEMPEKLIHLGFGKLNFLRLKELAQEAAINNKRNNKLIKFVYYKFLYYVFRLINVLNRRVLMIK